MRKKTLRTTGLDACQYSSNTIILFATQCKNDNTAFHRTSAVSGSLALLRAFCQWKIEHQVRSCVKGMIEVHGWARERCRPSIRKWLQEKNVK